jgi:signal peptidase II
MTLTPTKRMVLVAGLVLALDQFTKLLVMWLLGYGQQWVVLDGFFKFVCWGNTGAAWSLFYGKNKLLAVVAFLALIGLYLNRRHFDFHTVGGQFALGLISGGILGNLVDRVRVHSVIDFIYFFILPRGGGEIGFPAFNIADTAICTGVMIVFLLAWRNDQAQAPGSVAK